MGAVEIDLELENFIDRMTAQKNGDAAEVRALKIQALVDTGAVMNLLPQDVIEYLGVPIVDSAIVTLADERREEMPIAEGVTFKLAGRRATVPCLVGPPRCQALVGQVVLELLDLVVDCPGRRVLANPDSPIYPSLSLK